MNLELIIDNHKTRVHDIKEAKHAYIQTINKSNHNP